jgi:hypothetical protein
MPDQDVLKTIGTTLDDAWVDCAYLSAGIDQLKKRMISPVDAEILHGHLAHLQQVCDEFLDAHKALHNFCADIDRELAAKQRHPEW